ncbi:class I SAM-dependent methyltransferase [Patescibacteria group bacterium]|nr:class I SAM-dependent methyltransferase [Patescibacteria group bacterium]
MNKIFMSIFFSNNKEQKDYIWEKLNKKHPEFKTGGYFFRKYLKIYINNNSIIIDAGCGDNGILSEFKSIPKLIIGVDVNKKLLDKNQIVNKKIIANLEHIPLDSNSVDIVISEFVLEHLRSPSFVLKEIFRVLKPGGVFIFITPNIINPIMALCKILPHTIHVSLRKTLLKKEEETHFTYYKANTYRKLLKLGALVGFQNCEILRAGNPEYFGFCKPLVSISIFFEKLIDNNFLNILKMYLVGCFKKE